MVVPGPSCRRRAVVAALAVVLLALPAPTATGQSDADSRLLRELRDEAIANIGWVAGNAYGHPVWPRVKGYVGRDGEYTDAFLALAPRGSDHRTEAALNVALYEEWVERGRGQPFNEVEAVRRIARVNQIIEELRGLFKRLK